MFKFHGNPELEAAANDVFEMAVRIRRHVYKTDVNGDTSKSFMMLGDKQMYAIRGILDWQFGHIERDQYGNVNRFMDIRVVHIRSDSHLSAGRTLEV